MRERLYLRGELPLFGLLQICGKHRLHSAGWKRRLQNNRIKMLDHPVEGIRLSAPPSRNGGKFKTLSGQVPGKPWKKRHDSSRLDHTAAKSVGDLHVSGDDGVDEAGHAKQRITTQLQRIAEAVVNPAENHIDAFQPIDGLEIDTPVAHGEVNSLNQSET